MMPALHGSTDTMSKIHPVSLRGRPVLLVLQLLDPPQDSRRVFVVYSHQKFTSHTTTLSAHLAVRPTVTLSTPAITQFTGDSQAFSPRCSFDYQTSGTLVNHGTISNHTGVISEQ